MKDADCVAFLQWALPRLGLHWPGFRQVCRRIAARTRELSLAGAAEYRTRLEGDRAEWPVLAGLCTVSISRHDGDAARRGRSRDDGRVPARRRRRRSAAAESGRRA